MADLIPVSKPHSLKGWLIVVLFFAVVIAIAFILEAKKPGRISGLPVIKQLINAGTSAGTTAKAGT